MTRTFIGILLVASVFFALSCGAQASFLGRGAKDPAVFGDVTAAPLGAELLSRISVVQKDYRERMAVYARELREDPTGSSALLFLALCFAYGVVHAAGPGHGKSIVCAYFLARGGSLRHAAAFGNLIAVLHVSSAVILILGLAFLARSTDLFSFNSASAKLYPFSYLLVALVGVVFLIKSLLWSQRPRNEAATGPKTADTGAGSILVLSLAAGLVPCPGAAVIFLFCLNLGIVWAGLLAMVALAAGMGLTTSLVACVTVGSRLAALNINDRFGGLVAPAHRFLSITGSLMITILGLLLFLASLPSVNA